jgi:amidophosphoribosyltransferase
MAVGLLDPPTLPAVGFLPDGPVAVLVVGGLLAVPDVVAAAPSASEAVLELVRRSAQRTAVNRFVDALGLVRGGFVAVMVTGDRLVVAADASGVRGAVVARLGGGHVVASDLRALPEGSVSARAVLPGEVVVVDAEGASALRPFARRPEAACLMEAMCTAQPDERVGRRSAEAWRRELGVLLARHGMPDDASVVAAGEPAAEAVALAFASVVGAPLEPLVGTDGRASAARVAGRGVVLISASGGEGVAVDALLRAGASTVHVRRARPDLTARCPFGFRPVEGDPPSAAASDRALRLDELSPLLGAGGWCDACVGGIAPWSTESADVQLPLFRGA